MMLRTTLIALLSLAACNVDADGDGVDAQFDCDDENDTIYPDAPELCDGLDNDCNGIVDDATTDAPTFYADFDRDGFGNPDETTTDCRYDEASDGPDPDYTPFGYVANSDDCDDMLQTVNPDADERCDGIDNNCDGSIDGDDAIDKTTWFADSDGDGFGDPEATTDDCEVPSGHVANDQDCDDSTDLVNPAADEVCNGGIDDDCDGFEDEDDAIDALPWYRDSDEDDFGDASDEVFACTAPDGYVDDDQDCNDEAETAFPGGTEICDGLDNDCNPTTSEANTVSINATVAGFDTIQAAIDGASRTDTVYVCEGEWSESLELEEGITLLGPSGPDVTSIALPEETFGTVITLGTGRYTLEGLTVTDGTGGGVDAYDATAVTLRDMVVSNNTNSLGFSGGGGGGGGSVGGVQGPVDGDFTIEDSIIAGNTGSFGGGLGISGDATITNSRIADNEAEICGGLYAAGGRVTLTDTRVISNYAEGSGGGACADFGGTLDGGEYLNNLADGEGGGVALLGSLENATVKGNRTFDLGGGIAFFECESESCTLDNVVVEDNKSAFGGGLYVESDALDISNTEFLDNEATATGGAMYLTTSTPGDFTDITVTGNTATAGGGIHLVTGSFDVVRGDFGSGDADNDPDDIFANASGNSYTAFEDDETFTCDEGGICE